MKIDDGLSSNVMEYGALGKGPEFHPIRSEKTGRGIRVAIFVFYELMVL